MRTHLSRVAALLGAVCFGIFVASNALQAQERSSATAAWPSAPTDGVKGSAKNPVLLGSNWTAGFTPAYSIPQIAAKHGWTVKVIDFASSAQRATALAQGSIDLAMLGWSATIKLRTEGLPAVAISNSFSAGYAFIAKKDSTINAISDLKGRTVAITLGSMNEMHLLSQLALAGLPATEVKIVQMNLTDMPLALARGDIDVMVSDEPASSLALTSGFGALIKYPNDTTMGGINANVTTTEGFIKANQAAVSVVIHALVEATDSLNSNPDSLLAVARDIFKRDDAVVKMALKNIVLDYKMKPSEIDALATWQLNLKQIKEKPDMQELINSGFINEATRH